MPKSKLNTKPINDDRIVAKAPAPTKAKFYELCYNQGLIPSMVIRGLIEHYIAESEASTPAPRKVKA